jgi:hypothetical protein
MFFLIFWKGDVAKICPQKKQQHWSGGSGGLLPQAVLKSLALLLWENHQLMVLIWKMVITASPYGKDPSVGSDILRIRALGHDWRGFGGNLMFPLWFALLGGSFVFLDVGPSILFLVFTLFLVLWYIFDWKGVISTRLLSKATLIGNDFCLQICEVCGLAIIHRRTWPNLATAQRGK